MNERKGREEENRKEDRWGRNGREEKKIRV